MVQVGQRSANKMTYEESLMYCFLCTDDGHKDWRLPTIDEYLKYCRHQGWYENRPDALNFRVIPVRSI